MTAKTLKMPKLHADSYLKALRNAGISSPCPADHGATLREIAKDHLPLSLLESLDDFGRPGGSPFLVMDGLPIDEDVSAYPLPVDGRRPLGMKSSNAENVLLGILSLAKQEVFSYEEEYGGDPFQYLCPVEALSDVPTGRGRVPLEWHADNVALPRAYRPEALALIGQLSSSPVVTWVASAQEIFDRLPPRDAEVLCRPCIRSLSPASLVVDENGAQVLTAPHPVFYQGPRGELEIQVSMFNYRILPGDLEAEAAMRSLARVLDDDVAVATHLRPGTLLLTSNVRALHARGEVKGPRLVVRAYGRANLDDLNAIDVGRCHRYRARRCMASL